MLKALLLVKTVKKAKEVKVLKKTRKPKKKKELVLKIKILIFLFWNNIPSKILTEIMVIITFQRKVALNSDILIMIIILRKNVASK